MTQTAKERHINALLNPVTPEEQTLARLGTELVNLVDRYKGDRVMIPAIEALGTCMLRLMDGATHRIDQTMLTREVEALVAEAGGNERNL